MFSSSGQFFILLACVGFGYVSGVILTIDFALKKLFYNFFLRNILDLCSFLTLCFFFVLYTNFFNFPSFRVFMAIGVLIGLILYIESFHFILAKTCKIVYNKVKKIFTKKSPRLKVETNE